MLGFEAQRAVAISLLQKESTIEEAFQTFHLRGGQQQQHHHYSQSRWKDLGKKASGKSGGVALPLVHRDTRDSPFRAYLNAQQAEGGVQTEADFATIFGNSLQRDEARVRAIDSLMTKKTAAHHVHSRRVHGVTPPLESPIFPGLEIGSGEYFTTISIGTPEAPVLVTIDTGSDLVWVQCKPCDSCYDQIDPIFDSTKSSSYQPVPCHSKACAALIDAHCDDTNKKCVYLEMYGDQSFSTGEFASETIAMNSTARDSVVEVDRLLFGCGHDNEGLFTGSAGILGLGRGALSFPSQMANALAPRFSYCLTDRFPSTRLTADGATDGKRNGDGDGKRKGKGEGKRSGKEDGGDDGDGKGMTATSYLLFGELAATADMPYTALQRNPMAPSFYYLKLTGLSVGNELVAIPASALELDMSSGRGGAILDTGTAVTRLSTEAYEAVRDAFRLKASHLTRVELPNQEFFDSCYQLADGQSVPSVTMHFAGNVDLFLPIDNTVIPVDDSGSLYCLAFARSDVRGDLTIIGNIQQQGFRIEFDLGKNQVGFTMQDCSSR
ncbi:unnamed protein product [Calypogeia fissa]